MSECVQWGMRFEQMPLLARGRIPERSSRKVIARLLGGIYTVREVGEGGLDWLGDF